MGLIVKSDLGFVLNINGSAYAIASFKYNKSKSFKENVNHYLEYIQFRWKYRKFKFLKGGNTSITLSNMNGKIYAR